MVIQPTPHPDVNRVLELLRSAAKKILADRFVGMYLHGSLANGDFDEHSDVDVLVVTQDEIPEPVFAALQAMHARLAALDSPWAAQLEVSYIPQKALRRFDPANQLHPHLDRGAGEKLRWMRHASDWIIQRHILREKGITVAGPAPGILIDPLSPDDLRRAVVDVLPLWTNPILADPARRMQRRGYQSFIVLSLCRMLYTLQHGAVVSKPVAAEWAKKTGGGHWTSLIERALIGRRHAELVAQVEDINGTVELIHYVLTRNTLLAPTPYPDVNAVLALLLSNVQEILGPQFVGMYLYGSLSSGDFNPASSDIDFAVVTAGVLPAETVSALAAMHATIQAGGAKWAQKLEGSYLPKSLIRRHDPRGPACPTINEGRFYVDRRGSDWIIQRHVIREYGVVVQGPDPKTLIEPVAPGQIRQAVLGVLREWWFPMLDDPSWLRDNGAEYHAFAVITMCRVLHALEHGTVVSKPAAAQWTQAQFGGRWAALIEKALAAQSHDEPTGIPDFLDQALDLIRFTKQQTEKKDSIKWTTRASN